ncbi:hypothetical protein BDV23DRAFT_154327 [Aspergillus alliaceus]|uniref:SPT2 chromatin protein-domain-containing protein n=1 Tax=Petromyces alliaceus TaxID=209559 RepID=A0A5N7C9G6_PETAA|nr:hypothetical protein BDV23DRAFT_154327 [Aspergillus alliaceus]
MTASSSAVSKPRPIATPAAKPALKSSVPQPSASRKAAPVSSKPPPRGSYAEIMAKAKALQEKAPAQVGMFKHQAVPKEKLSKMERKKRAMEAQAKEKDARSGKKPAFAPNSGIKSGDGKPSRKREPEELSYKGTSRPTPSTAVPEYKGTAGIPARRPPDDRKAQVRAGKRSRMDEYLGTDEEDEGDYADGYDDYYSDASSDMEGGFDDVENEEAAALAAARKEDEEEWRLELAAKQAKLERRNKLALLASRRR